jgi:hypothetical protein
MKPEPDRSPSVRLDNFWGSSIVTTRIPPDASRLDRGADYRKDDPFGYPPKSAGSLPCEVIAVRGHWLVDP